MTKTEANKLLGYLNEQTGASITMRIYSARRYSVRGHAHPDEKWFSLPHYVMAHPNKHYSRYYIVHEFTHCLGYRDHGPAFKARERKVLALLDMDICYAKAYPKSLACKGEIVYKRSS